MNPELYANPKSDQYDIRICEDCKMNEYAVAEMNAPLPLVLWRYLREHARDFENMPYEQALAIIEDTQMFYLTSLFKYYYAVQSEVDEDDLYDMQLDAYEKCPGLTEVWMNSLFRYHYAVAEGTLKIRFCMRHNHPVYTAEIVYHNR